MQNFLLAAGVVLPLVIYMLIGWGVRRANILTREHMKAFNLFVFRVLLPLSLFFNVYKADLGEVVRPKLFLCCFLGMVLFSGIAWLIMGHLTDNPSDRATLAQGTFRSNYALFGGSIAAVLCGTAGNAMIGALTAVIVPTMNVLSVVVFERARGGKMSVGHTLKEVVKNPLVIGGMLGLLASALHLRFPALLTDPLQQLAKTTTPIALVILGGILSAESIRRHVRLISAAMLMRLVLIPLTAVAAAILLGFRGDEMVAVIAIFASPTAVASAPMAQVMGGNGPLASEIVAATTVVSVFTIFLFVYTLSSLGLL